MSSLAIILIILSSFLLYSFIGHLMKEYLYIRWNIPKEDVNGMVMNYWEERRASSSRTNITFLSIGWPITLIINFFFFVPMKLALKLMNKIQAVKTKKEVLSKSNMPYRG